MKVLRAPLVVFVFFSLSLAAQESLPDSYAQKLVTIDRLLKLSSNDLADLTFNAQSGASDAQYQLALIYEAGRVVPRNLAASGRWMRKSAEQGYVSAETGMGLMYLDDRRTGAVPNHADAERWLLQAAVQGDAEAQLWLGTGYDRGCFGDIDYQESLKWLRKSADQGLPDAQFALAQMYEDGHGVRTSDEDAAYWYRRAADHFSDISGVFEAEVQLAYMYRDGRLKTNDVEAYMWFAIVGAAVQPPTDEDVKEVSKSMSQPQIVEAQQRVATWTLHHPPRPR